jgi:glycosyltransferase involved in cell wall biosynthesis
MRLIVDGRPLVPSRSGIGVHTAEIAGRLDIDPPPLIASHAPIANRQGIERCRFRVDRAPNGILWQQLVLPRIADADVLWGPHGTMPIALRIPAVVTLHDFSSITMPGRHLFRTVASFNLFISESLSRAKRIAAVSRAIASEAMRWFAVPPRLLEIVPNGVDDFFSPSPGALRHPLPADAGRGPTPTEPPLPVSGERVGVRGHNFILFVGTLEPRKGIDDLIAVWQSLAEPRPRLVLCGERGWRVRVPDGVEVTGWVDRERLRELYRRARVFVYPSRYEGFGIPPLEAMACGAPVIATRTGAIPEYAEGAALLIDPGDREALRDGLTRLLADRELREDLGARGVERAKQYRWERSARLMTDLLTEAVR